MRGDHTIRLSAPSALTLIWYSFDSPCVHSASIVGIIHSLRIGRLSCAGLIQNKLRGFVNAGSHRSASFLVQMFQQPQCDSGLSITNYANATVGAGAGLAKNPKHKLQRFWRGHFAIV
jgi:hypothetical protein